MKCMNALVLRSKVTGHARERDGWGRRRDEGTEVRSARDTVLSTRHFCAQEASREDPIEVS
uniref:Uncharacterized protein n=1 Tax=Pristionchus pacificus TaxID=54126 RepID=A0A2A6CGV6_PRIPA|eukprot:PDM77241.1 hypothetical protein PRIPAC_43153 [Pristionchus pacificus]